MKQLCQNQATPSNHTLLKMVAKALLQFTPPVNFAKIYLLKLTSTGCLAEQLLQHKEKIIINSSHASPTSILKLTYTIASQTCRSHDKGKQPEAANPCQIGFCWAVLPDIHL